MIDSSLAVMAWLEAKKCERATLGATVCCRLELPSINSFSHDSLHQQRDVAKLVCLLTDWPYIEPYNIVEPEDDFLFLPNNFSCRSSFEIFIVCCSR
jgi:hypothetical protein